MTNASDGLVFYTYDNCIELNGRVYGIGELTEDILNLTPDDYRPMHELYESISALESEYESGKDFAVWWELNNRLERLDVMLRKYLVFDAILSDNNELFAEARRLTENYDLFKDRDFALTENTLSTLEDGVEDVDLNDMPEVFLVYPGNKAAKWRYYDERLWEYHMYLHDIRAFNQTIRNFIKYEIQTLEHNSPESYAEALYRFYNNPCACEKLIVNPIANNCDCYTIEDAYSICYEPRELTDGRFYICERHSTRSLQSVLKADYLRALNSGRNIRRCLVCGRYFLVTSGAHALYCEGSCPHKPEYTCRQFGAYDKQKELAKDNPKLGVRVRANARITKDMQRGRITSEEARRAKDYVRDHLYEALRQPDYSVADFESAVSTEKVYSFCGITRTANPRGRPKAVGESDEL